MKFKKEIYMFIHTQIVCILFILIFDIHWAIICIFFLQTSDECIIIA